MDHSVSEEKNQLGTPRIDHSPLAQTNQLR